MKIEKQIDSVYYAVIRCALVCFAVYFFASVAWRDMHAAPVVPTRGIQVGQTTVTIHENTAILFWMPDLQPGATVLNYCLYRSAISGKEVKSDCHPPAKLLCPVYTPPLNPLPPPTAVCWTLTLPANPSKVNKSYFLKVTQVVESPPSDELVAVQPGTGGAAPAAVTPNKKPSGNPVAEPQ